MFKNNFEEDNDFINQELELHKRTEQDTKYLSEYFGFDIVNYIVMDLVENATYEHFCLMVNMSRLNNGISNEDAEKLKNFIKEQCHINSQYDIVSDEFISNLYNHKPSDSFEEWKEHYYNDEKYNINDIFTKEEQEIIKRLGIEIKNKIYTEYEFECLQSDIGAYYIDPEYCEEEISVCKDLSTTNVTNKEFIKVFKALDRKYNENK